MVDKRINLMIFGISLFIVSSIILPAVSAGYTGPWYNLALCPQRYNVTITETSGNAINNYFITNISINLTDIGFNHSILVVNSSNVSIPFKLYDGMNGTRNATLMFNVTLPAGGSDDWSIYNCSGLPSRTTYNITNWAGGTDFDADNVDDIFPGWNAATGTANVSITWYALSGDTGNHSAEFQTDANKWLGFGQIAKGSAEYWVKVPATTFSEMGFYDGEGGTMGFIISIIDGRMRYRDGAGYVNITEGLMISGQEYHVSVQWDSSAEKYNVTVYNGTWTFTANGADYANSIAQISWMRIETPSEVSYIDNIIARSGTVYPEPSSFIQAKEPHAFAACDDTYTQPILTFNVMNESDGFAPINASMDMTLTIEMDDFTYTHNDTITNDSYHLCTDSDWAQNTIDGQIQYANSSYRTRNYYLDTVTSTTGATSIGLHLLSTTLGTKPVEITVKDQYLNDYPEVIVKPQRWYPGLGAYRNVSSLKTNDQGVVVEYLELSNDVEYQFSIEQAGNLLKTISRLPIIDDGTSVIEKEFIITVEELVEWLIYKDKVSGSCTYLNTSGNLTCSYTDVSDDGKLETVWLTVKRYYGAFSSNTTCDFKNTSMPTGSFICHLGNETAAVSTYVYKMLGTLDTAGGEYHLFYSNTTALGEAKTKLFGDCTLVGNIGKCREGAVITFLLVTLSTLVGIVSPPTAIIMCLAGLGISSAVGLFAITMQQVIGLGFVAAVLIFRMRVK